VTHENKGKNAEKGALRADQNQMIFAEGFSFSGYERDALFLNLGSKKLLDISGVSGIDSITDGRAAVFADFDNDGDLDVFVTTIQGQGHLLFRNNVGQKNAFLRVALQGARSGRDANGAVVRVQTSAGTLAKIKSAGSGFLSQHDPRLLFGLDKDTRVEAIEVTWPSGEVEKFRGALAGTSVLLQEGTAKTRPEGMLVSERRMQLPDPLSRTALMTRHLKLRVGQPFPAIPVKTLSGETTTLAQQLKPGRSSIINLWATWCVPCAREIPELQRISSDLATRNIDVIGLNLDTDPNANVKGYLEKRQVSYLNLIGGVAAIEGIYATDQLFVPLSILIDHRGTVVDVISGWSAESQQKFARLQLNGVQ